MRQALCNMKVIMMAMAAFSSNETRCMEQNYDVNSHGSHKLVVDSSIIRKCTQWITQNDYHKVCLQFPDELLSDSTEILYAIQQLVTSQLFILGDSTYGSCCIDEVSAEHVEGDAIIHFGHACLSPIKRLPVLYIFPTYEISKDDFISKFREEFGETNKSLQLIFDVAYEHASDSIYKQLSLFYPNLEVAELAFKTSNLNSNNHILRLGRNINLQIGKNFSDYTFIYIGEDNRTFTNFLYELAESEFYIYEPFKSEDGVRHVGQPNSKFLMKRMYLVERVKDARSLGVLIGTLGIDKYLDAIERVKKLAVASGKRVYVIAVGRPNVPKLANFPEIDVFVHIACPESILLESREFYQPIVSLYEVELACNLNCQQRFVADFRRLVQGGEREEPVPVPAADVSLVTGKVRSLETDDEQLLAENRTAVARRPDLVVSVGAGDFLATRSWRGLETNLGETPIELAVEGRSGIAAGYEAEPITLAK